MANSNEMKPPMKKHDYVSTFCEASRRAIVKQVQTYAKLFIYLFFAVTQSLGQTQSKFPLRRTSGNLRADQVFTSSLFHATSLALSLSLHPTREPAG